MPEDLKQINQRYKSFTVFAMDLYVRYFASRPQVCMMNAIAWPKKSLYTVRYLDLPSQLCITAFSFDNIGTDGYDKGAILSNNITIRGNTTDVQLHEGYYERVI